MASKVYTIMKDGEAMKQVKGLAAAKKIADIEDAEVFYEGLCVYSPDPDVRGIDPDPAALDTAMPDLADPGSSVPDSAGESEGPPVKTGKAVPERYRLTALMNVRKEPSMEAEIVGRKPEGTAVDVIAVRDGWMCLADGTYILFNGGEFAVKEG